MFAVGLSLYGFYSDEVGSFYAHFLKSFNPKASVLRRSAFFTVHNQNQNSPTKIKYNSGPGEERKPKIISTRAKLIKAQTEKQN